MGGNMKVHQYEFPRGMLIRSWDQQSQLIESASPASLSSFCQRFRPLLPSSHTTSGSNSSTAFRFDLKSFIKPHHCSSNETNVVSSGSDDKVGDHRLTQVQVETTTHPGGTRWNPTQEQIGILERLYKEGMRTPNSQQIEQITWQLAKFGKIEGKNVFYWFQNHKARQRQKMKRRSLGLAHSPRTSMATISSTSSSMEDQEFEDGPLKRKRGARSFLERSECDEMSTREDNRGVSTKFEALSDGLSGLLTNSTLNVQNQTLELFPLHPEGRSRLIIN